MVALNAKGEVADILDVNQFQPGRSAYECVAYAGALCKYAGQPGHGPTGSALQASNLAQYWYGREEGNNLASNQNGMSLQAEYDMLKGMGLTFHEVTPNVSAVKSWLERGNPLMICGAETGMVDLELGRVPYSWTPTGNHCIVASGIAHDGNLLVHDCASIAPTGVRTGPRTYDASKLSLISATAIDVPWLGGEEEVVTIDLNTPGVSNFFEAVPGNNQQWHCKQTGKIVQFGILSAYRGWGNSALCGLTYLGLPKSNEIPLPNVPGAVKQYYERGCVIYDPSHKIDNPPGAGSVYAAHLYDNGVGTDPAIATLETEIAQLKAQGGNADALTAIHAIQSVVAPFK